jgi:inner membrane protein
MTKKTHIAVGFAATLPLMGFFPKYAIIGLMACTIPDIDVIIKLKHRTFTHSFLAMFCTTVLVTSVNFYVGIIFGLNYLIHLVLDSFTNMGVPLFYPYQKKTYGLKLFLTGEFEDLFICVMAVLIITILWSIII